MPPTRRRTGSTKATPPPIASGHLSDRTGVGFDLRWLHVFLTVCDSGGMTSAARKLGMTQPAVSQIVRMLESGIGAPLLDRSVRPLALTTAGERLHERATHLLEEARQVLPAVLMDDHHQMATMRIGILDSVSHLITSALFALLRPKVKLLLIWSGSSASHRDALLFRQLSMIVTNDEVENFEGFESHALVEEPFVRILPRSAARLADRSLVEITQTLPLIRYASRSYIGQRIERHLRHVRAELPRTIEVDRTEQVAGMVESGLGWAITTPLSLLQARPNYPQLTIAPLPPPRVSRQITLLAHPEELGRLPRQVAQAIERTFREDCLPRLLETMPWLESEMRFGRDIR